MGTLAAALGIIANWSRGLGTDVTGTVVWVTKVGDRDPATVGGAESTSCVFPATFKVDSVPLC